MAQKLILPLNKCKLTASMSTTKEEPYTVRFGFKHYGVDMVSTSGSTKLFGLGEGIVVATGWDSACGYVVAVVYKNVINNKTGQVSDITIRYFHLRSISCRVNQKVNINTIIGYYGKTGRYSGTGAHLHVEADLDTKYVLYTPTVTASDYLRGTKQGATPYTSSKNTVVNPLNYFYIKTTPPENQTYTTANDIYIKNEDKFIPKV